MKCVVVPPKTDARPEPPASTPPVNEEAPFSLRTSTVFTSAKSASTTVPAAVIEIVSLATPPMTVAAVFSAAALAKTIVSAPAPASILSIPPPPTIESAPLPDTIESPPDTLALPRMVSAPLPPTIVQPFPLAAELAVPSIQVGLEKEKILVGLRL